MGQRHALAAALLLAACAAKKASKVKATKPPNEYSTGLRREAPKKTRIVLVYRHTSFRCGSSASAPVRKTSVLLFKRA